MWDVEVYRKMMRKIVHEGTFDGETVKSQSEIFELLSEKLYVSFDTVKGWTRKHSNGPGDAGIVKQLEEILGVKLMKNDLTSIKNGKESDEMKYSDFVKESIWKCYDRVMCYITNGDIEDEEEYCKMRTDLGRLKIAVPIDIYNKIEEFIDMNLDPIIYEHDSVFKDFYTEELGSYNDDGVFCLKDEHATMMIMGKFLEMQVELEKKFEGFGRRELYPLIMS